MTLLDDVLIAAGGLTRWTHVRQFSAHVSLNGALIHNKYKKGSLKDIVVEGSTATQSVQITGFPAPNLTATFHPDKVSIEAADGSVQYERQSPRDAFLGHTWETPWDPLHVVYYCGSAIWNYMTTPFLFTRSGFRTEELPRVTNGSENWRCLKVVFPDEIATHSPQQLFYFNSTNLQCRLDYRDELACTDIVQLSSAHQAYCGIVIPTLRRSRRALLGGNLAGDPPCLDMEIFDAHYE